MALAFYRAVEFPPVKAAIEKAFRLAASRTDIPFAVRFADGSQYRSSSAPPEFTVVFRNSRAYRRTALLGHVGLLEAYFDGDVDIEGSLPKALQAGMQSGVDEPNWLVRLANRWHEFVNSNASWNRAKRNAEFHYALGPDFYKLWLDDPLMLYT